MKPFLVWTQYSWSRSSVPVNPGYELLFLMSTTEPENFRLVASEGLHPNIYAYLHLQRPERFSLERAVSLRDVPLKQLPLYLYMTYKMKLFDELLKGKI
jgi:hypothetical protein